MQPPSAQWQPGLDISWTLILDIWSQSTSVKTFIDDEHGRDTGRRENINNRNSSDA